MNTLNIYSKSDDQRGRVLSNFSHHPFVLDGRRFESVEGFVQGIAFPEGDARRVAAFKTWGGEAKKFELEQEKQFVWWNGEKIVFGSVQEHALIERAIRAKFEQNNDAAEALRATSDLVLTHILPEPEPKDTCLSASLFCGMLMRIRKEMNEYENMRQERFYAGGFLYNPKTRSVLLHKRDSKAKVNPNLWAFFGGLSEGSESPKQTFMREMNEELGIRIPEENIRSLCDYLNEELRTHRYIFFVESDLEKSKMRLMEGEDFDWIPLDNVFGYSLTEKSVKDLKLFLQTLNERYGK